MENVLRISSIKRKRSRPCQKAGKYVLSKKRRLGRPGDRSIKIKKIRRRNNEDNDEEYDSDMDADFSPFSHENCDSDDDDMDLFGKKHVYVRENHIYYKTNVNDASITKLINIINKKNHDFREKTKDPSIDKVVPKPIYLHITSYGGSLMDCFRAMDTITSSAIPIYTIIDGYAASCGSLMAVVGKKRYITPSSMALMHQLSYGCHGTYREMNDEHLNSKSLMEFIIKTYEERTNMERKEIKKQLKHDSWWNADTCLENKLVDEIWYGEK